MRHVCDCGHDKRDHVLPRTGDRSYGSCKVCLCDAYAQKGVATTPVDDRQEALVQQS